MSNMPPQPGFSAGPFPQTPLSPAPVRGPSRWALVAVSAIALIALGAAVTAWLRPIPERKTSSPPPVAYNQQQVADAKTKVCGAFKKVWNSEQIAGGRSGGADPTATLAVATSIRQVLDFGSRYLTEKLDTQPATPPDLGSAVRELVGTYQELTMSYLNGLTNTDTQLGPLLSSLDKQTYAVQGLCK